MPLIQPSSHQIWKLCCEFRWEDHPHILSLGSNICRRQPEHEDHSLRSSANLLNALHCIYWRDITKKSREMLLAAAVPHHRHTFSSLGVWAYSHLVTSLLLLKSLLTRLLAHSFQPPLLSCSPLCCPDLGCYGGTALLCWEAQPGLARRAELSQNSARPML